MSRLAKGDILKLSVAERIQLVADIWGSIADAPESVSLTDEQKAELARRLDAYHKDREAGSPCELVRERISNDG